ncbi:MAG: hypothetical protein KBA50_08585 [Sedimentibacter sp.]|nr:hypothetical protein [Sedimentibacter sp.]
MKKIVLILSVLTTIVSGCDKYEQTLKKIYGHYTITTYSVNGVDSLIMYRDSLGPNFNFFYEEVNDVNVLQIDGNRNDGNNYPIICKWNLIDKNQVLNILTAYAYTGTGPFGNNITPKWNLLNIKDGKIQMATNYNEKEYFIELQ